MHKTLYISDLDGTLLNDEAILSSYTQDKLQYLINRGVNFSVATARTPASAVQIMKNLNLQVPAVLMNGVLIYDMHNQNCIKQENLPPEASGEIIRILRHFQIDAFMYVIQDNKMTTYYESLEDPMMFDFYQLRVQKYRKSFEETADFNHVDKDNAVYFTLRGDHEKLNPVYEEIKALDLTEVVLYRDNYTENMWFLECFSKKASKYNAVRYLREQYHYERVVGFGDNLNDLPLFRASDEAYAVENAVPEAKKEATAIIGRNTDDAVAKWLFDHI